jgi:hypothetical protein
MVSFKLVASISSGGVRLYIHIAADGEKRITVASRMERGVCVIFGDGLGKSRIREINSVGRWEMDGIYSGGSCQ